MRTTIPKYLNDLIAQKEGLKLDFKFEISDVRKISRTLAAFANTQGGILLIGVKDNGKIAGIRTEEEIYMIEAAAKLFCRPKIDLQFRQWQVNDKTVLEVIIPKSSKRPHFAQDENNKWKSYIRVNDKIFTVNNVQIRVWKNQTAKNRKSINIKFNRKEDFLLNYLLNNEYITFKKFYKIANISPKTAEDVLVDLITLDLIEITYTNEGIARYKLKKQEQANKLLK